MSVAQLSAFNQRPVQTGALTVNDATATALTVAGGATAGTLTSTGSARVTGELQVGAMGTAVPVNLGLHLTTETGAEFPVPVTVSYVASRCGPLVTLMVSPFRFTVGVAPINRAQFVFTDASLLPAAGTYYSIIPVNCSTVPAGGVCVGAPVGSPVTGGYFLCWAGLKVNPGNVAQTLVYLEPMGTGASDVSPWPLGTVAIVYPTIVFTYLAANAFLGPSADVLPRPAEAPAPEEAAPAEPAPSAEEAAPDASAPAPAPATDPELAAAPKRCALVRPTARELFGGPPGVRRYPATFSRRLRM